MSGIEPSITDPLPCHTPVPALFYLAPLQSLDMNFGYMAYPPLPLSPIKAVVVPESHDAFDEHEKLDLENFLSIADPSMPVNENWTMGNDSLLSLAFEDRSEYAEPNVKPTSPVKRKPAAHAAESVQSDSEWSPVESEQDSYKKKKNDRLRKRVEQMTPEELEKYRKNGRLSARRNRKKRKQRWEKEVCDSVVLQGINVKLLDESEKLWEKIKKLRSAIVAQMTEGGPLLVAVLARQKALLTYAQKAEPLASEIARSRLRP